MPTIKVHARFTVRASASFDVTDEEYERIKADPETATDEIIDQYDQQWDDNDGWQDREVFAIDDGEGNTIYEA